MRRFRRPATTTAMVHSARAQATLRLLDMPETGWDIPPIDWHEEMRTVPTKVPCPTCKGVGRVKDEAAMAAAGGHDYIGRRCPTCPLDTSRSYGETEYGKGEVIERQQRLVMVGIVRWPVGARHPHRFQSAQQCGLCGKRIRSGFSWLPVMNETVTPPIALWVGKDCGKKLLGLTRPDMIVETDAEGAVTGVWKEIPKEKPLAKPKPPELAKPDRATLDAIIAEAFPGKVADVHGSSYYPSRGTLEYTFRLDADPLDRVRGLRSYTLKVTAKFGATMRRSYPATQLWKDKTGTDVVAALRAALPAVRANFETKED